MKKLTRAEKISLAKKGKKRPPFSKEWIKNMSLSKTGRKGELNNGWKGDNIDYKSSHARVNRMRGRPKKCEECKTTIAKYYDWHNLTGKYHDPKDYIRVCKSCHAKLDGRIKNITKK